MASGSNSPRGSWEPENRAQREAQLSNCTLAATTHHRDPLATRRGHGSASMGTEGQASSETQGSPVSSVAFAFHGIGPANSGPSETLGTSGNPACASCQFRPSLLTLDAEPPTQTFPEASADSKELSNTYQPPALCWALPGSRMQWGDGRRHRVQRGEDASRGSGKPAWSPHSATPGWWPQARF